ncbi:hypothetical protein [Actinokineospora guangxiensis]
MSGYEIYHALHGGPGSSALREVHDITVAEAKHELERAKRITALGMKIESGWQGSAGAAAFGAAYPIARVSSIGVANLERTDQLLDQQAHSFDSAKGNVVPVAERAPETGFLDDIAPWSTDTETEYARHQAKSEHNIRVYDQYDMASWDNESALPTDYPSLDGWDGEIVVDPPERTPPPGGPGDRDDVTPPGGGDRGEGRVTPPPVVGDERTRPQLVDDGTTLPQQVDSKVVQPGRLPVVPPVTPPPGPTTFPPYLPQGLGSGSGGAGRGAAGTAGGRPGGAGGIGGRPGGIGPGALGAEGRSHGQADPHARGQGAQGGGRGGMGGAGGGARGQGGEDEEHTRASFLQEDDPEAIFGTDQVTAPPVIGG